MTEHLSANMKDVDIELTSSRWDATLIVKSKDGKKRLFYFSADSFFTFGDGLFLADDEYMSESLRDYPDDEFSEHFKEMLEWIK